MTSWRLLVAIAMGCAIAAVTSVARPGAARAQAAGEVQVSVEPRVVGVGSPVRLTIQVAARQTPGDATPGRFSGFRLLTPTPAVQHQIYMSLGGGPAQVTFAFTWTLVAEKTGTFSIGPPSVVVDGRRLTGAAQRVEVVPAGQAPAAPQRANPLDPLQQMQQMLNGLGGIDEPPGIVPQLSPRSDPTLALDAPRDRTAFLHATIDKTAAVVGEQVTLSVWIYQDPDEREPDYNDAHEPAALDFLSHPLVQNDIDSVRGTLATVGGRTWVAKLLRKTALFPLRAGDLEIGAMALGVVRGKASAMRESERLRVHVTEPPLRDRPPGYVVGDVGAFALAADVGPREVPRGDAVGVRVELTGTGNLPSKLAVPVQSGIEWLPPDVREKIEPKGDLLGGSRTFAYVVRLQREGTVDLGEIALPYWDPRDRTYRTARVTLGTVHVLPGAPSTAGSGEASTELFPDLPAFRTTRGATKADGAHLADRPLFWWALGASPIAYVVAASARRGARRVRAHFAARGTSPAADLRARVRDAEAAAAGSDARACDAACVRALEAATIAKCGVNVRGASGDARAARLTEAGIARDVADEIAAVLRACEEARFSPADSDIAHAQARWGRARRAIDALSSAPSAAPPSAPSNASRKARA